MLKHFLSTLILTLISQIASAQSIPVQMDAHQHVVMFQKGVDAFLVGEYDKCDDYWLPLARAGDPMAARNMGLLFHKGLGVRKDVEEAILYYKIAADAGVTSAQLSLGLIYLKGDGV
ncbi:MAG: tetratricopeptide repeat protein, partial [Pseudomonadota bacterium]